MIQIQAETKFKDPKLGFYKVQENIYWDKASALLAASKLNLTLEHVHWNFNDDVFSLQDWLDEPPGTLQDYYHARARQLREKYDYIVVNCSGGADSTTALFAFLDQGLFVDEVIVRYAKQGTNKYGFDLYNLDASNEHSEFKYAALPMLATVKKMSPNTKITIHDFSKDLVDDKLYWDENYIYWVGDYLGPGCITRYAHNTMIDSLRNFDKGKTVGIVFGIDKPKVILHQGKFYGYFLDRPVHSPLPATVTNGWDNISIELFFWTPDLPKLMIKQCHEILKWFSMPENIGMRHILNLNKQQNSVNRTTYEAIIKAIVYPDYDLNTFQANKPSQAVAEEWENWFYSDYSDSKGFKIWKRGLEFIKNNISTNFLKGNIHSPDEHWEYHPIKSNFYLIGTLSDTRSQGKIILPYLNY